MGSFLDKPKTEKTTCSGQGNNLSYGLSAMQGWRIEMEDSHCSLIGLPKAGLEQWSFFAVFDGHAGATVSKYSAEELIKSILDADSTLFEELAKSNNNNNNLNAITNNRPNSPSLSPSSVANNINNNSSNSSPKPNLIDSNNELNDNSTNNININNKLTNSTNSLKNDTNSSNTSSNINNSETLTNNTQTNNNNDNVDPNTPLITSSSSSSNLKISNSNSSLNTTSSTTTTTTKSTSNLNNNSLISSEEIQIRLKKAIRQGFLDLDEKIRRRTEFERGEDKSGSTAVACLISPHHVYLINCGDSRAISVSDNQILLATYDHKPVNPAERERIHNAGGSVMIQRVNGSLAVSRALGDYEYKSVEGRGPCEQLVSPEPEIYVHERSDKDEFVVLACDGIWDVMTNEDLKDYIRSRLKVTNDLVRISNDVLDMCLSKVSKSFHLQHLCTLKTFQNENFSFFLKGSRDNMSIIIVSFPGAPKVVEEEVEKDKTCNEKIENRVKG